MLKELFTERDNMTYCLGRFISASASIVLFYKFAMTATPDLVSFGTAVAAIVTSIAAKNYSEKQ